jgi:hypothetical protein
MELLQRRDPPPTARTVEAVVTLYNTQSTKPRAHDTSCFDDDVIFEDAAGRLKGLSELTTAFIALSVRLAA